MTQATSVIYTSADSAATAVGDLYEGVNKRLPLIDAVLLVRIYREDKAKWSKLELEQWFEYMFYAGVQNIYVYDNYKFKNESLGNVF